MTPYVAECARFLKHLMMSLEHESADRSDIKELSSRMKRLRGEDEALNRLVFITASRALRWATFGTDKNNVLNAADALVKALKQKT